MNTHRLLVVEDEIDLADCILEYFQDFFQRVDVVHSSSAAVEAFERDKYSVIISDYNLPGMNGLELLKVMKSLGNNTPVIWISGRAGMAEFRDGLKEGVFEFLEKPFHLEKLQEAVDSALAFGEAYVKSKR